MQALLDFGMHDFTEKSTASLNMPNFPAVVFLSLVVSAFAATAPPPLRLPNGDPCGPDIQDNPNYPNTCNAIPALVEAPSVYGINCTQIYDVESAGYQVQWDNCEASIEDACNKMEDSRTVAGIWIWSAVEPQCAIGFFLPPFRGSASVPSAQRCVDIFTAMNDTCSTTVPPTNYGSINLKTLPGYDRSYFDGGENMDHGWPNSDYHVMGNAINVGYPSYALAVQKGPLGASR